MLLLLLGLTGCGLGPSEAPSSAAEATSQNQSQGRGGGPGESAGEGKGKSGRDQQPPIVEILKATAGGLDDGQTYSGSTEPRQQVEVKSQLTAQILNLSVDVGDSVTQGQVIAQLDPKLLKAALGEAEAELAVRRAELSQARSSLGETQAAIDEAKAALSQAKADAARLRSLSKSGAIAQQQADLAQTEQRVAEQRLISAQEQFRTKGDAIAAAQQRVKAQQAVLSQEQERLAQSQIQAPISGVVLTKQAETGDLAQAGQALLTLGDLRETQVVVQVTDQDRGKVQLGQTVQVQLDAFPGEIFGGRVTQISPLADAASRLIPVEIALNSSEPLGSGLLARVRLDASGAAAIAIPQSALEVGKAAPGSSQTKTGTLFVVTATEPAKVQAQTVTLGNIRNGQAEILAGLPPGALYIVTSDQPLSDGQTIRRSLASEF